MKVAAVKEHAAGEARVALVPEVVRKLTSAGHEVLVESGAGDGALIPDALFADAGATLTSDQDALWGADVVVKVAPPSAEEAAKLLATIDPADDVIVCTDLFGGSVNNEFTKIVQTRPRTYLVTNMNLPLLIQLLFSDESAPVEETIRAIVAADDTRVKFVNDLLVDNDEEEEF